jgi:hypothetical protein
MAPALALGDHIAAAAEQVQIDSEEMVVEGGDEDGSSSDEEEDEDPGEEAEREFVPVRELEVVSVRHQNPQWSRFVFHTVELTTNVVVLEARTRDDYGQWHKKGTVGVYGNFLEPETGEFNAGVHWIDVRQRAFFPLELIVGVQLGGEEPRVVPTIVTDCDDEWAVDLPRQQGKWIGSGTKRKWVEDESSAFCECLVLPDFEFDRLHALARVEGGSATSAV